MFTPWESATIRSLWLTGECTQGQIARRYGVTVGTISKICRRRGCYRATTS